MTPFATYAGGGTVADYVLFAVGLVLLVAIATAYSFFTQAAKSQAPRTEFQKAA